MNMKFKVWDSVGKCFLPEIELRNYYVNYKGELIINSYRIKIIYSTGQTDKSGKEIFEGDIRGKNWWKYIVCYGKFLVEEDETGYEIKQIGFYKQFLDKKYGVAEFNLIDDLNDPNIGNKYENPELLEQNET